MRLVTSFTLLAFAALPVRVATHLPDTGLEPSYPIAKSCAHRTLKSMAALRHRSGVLCVYSVVACIAVRRFIPSDAFHCYASLGGYLYPVIALYNAAYRLSIGNFQEFAAEVIMFSCWMVSLSPPRILIMMSATLRNFARRGLPSSVAALAK